MNKPVTYTHENGYSATLYGDTSLSIDYGGREVLNTGQRNVETEDEVMNLLEHMPDLMNNFQKFSY